MLHRNVKKIVSYLLTFVLVLGLFMGIDLNVQADEEFYTINFDGNGAPGTQHSIRVSKSADSFDIPECEFEWEGHTFIGWKVSNAPINVLVKPHSQYDPINKSSFASLFGEEGSTTFVAQWADTNDCFTVKFDGNGADSGTTDSIKVYNGERIYDVKAPQCGYSKNDYVFKGWCTNKDGSGTIISPGSPLFGQYDVSYSVIASGLDDSKTLTLYALWDKEYTINFDGNGAESGDTASLTGIIPNCYAYAPQCGYNKSGYTFKCWNTKKDGTGTNYNANSSMWLSQSLFDESNSLTLYAIWWDNNDTFSINFDGNGEDSGMTSALSGITLSQIMSLSYYGKVHLPKCGYNKDGYSFKCWNTKADGSGKDLYPYEVKQYGNTLSFDDFDQNGMLSLYAIWWDNNDTFTINFDGNGADSGTTASMTGLTLEQIQNGVIMPQCGFEKDGYSFMGWNKDINSNAASVLGSLVYISPGSGIRFYLSDFDANRELTIYSMWWKDRTYTINFDGNGDGVIGSTESLVISNTPYDELYVTLPECGFTWEGHTFNGWTHISDSNYRSSYSRSIDKRGFETLFAQTDEITLYAQWLDNNQIYPITFNFDGNGATSGTMESYNEFGLTSNGYIKLPNCQYQRDDYEFVGWSTMSDSTGTSYDYGGIIASHSVSPGNRSNTVYTPGSYVMVNTNNYNYASNKTITFYAIWTKSDQQKSYQIIYDGNGASGSMEADIITASDVYQGKYKVSKCTYNKNGNIFIGWNTKADGTGLSIDAGRELGSYTFSNMFASSDRMTLYAQWDTNTDEWNIKYDGNGSTSGSTASTYGLKKNSKYTVPECGYQKKGYLFKCWNTKPDGTGVSVRPGAELYHSAIIGFDPSVFIGYDGNLWDYTYFKNPGTHTLYAQWAEDNGNRYSFVYNGNGANSGSMNVDSNITGGPSYSIKDCNYSKSGYRFKCWNTKPDGTGHGFSPGKKISDNNSVKVYSYFKPGSNNLYAQWVKNEIVFDGSSATSGTMSPLTISDSATSITIPNCSYKRNGCMFLTWNTMPDGSGKRIDPGVYKVDSEEINYLFNNCVGSTAKLYPVWVCDTGDIVDCGESNHKWGAVQYSWNGTKCTATRTCQNNPMHKETETVTATSTVTKEATCIQAGTRKYTATFKNPAFATQTKTETIEALGHKWGAVTYKWSSDGKKCTATRVCKNDKTHKQTETVNAKLTVTKKATCMATGTKQYVAKFKNAAFKTQTHSKKYTIQKVASAHTWGAVTYKWSADGKTCTATRVCTSNKNHKQTETVKATATVAKKATATAMGQTKYTAKFKNAAFGTKAITKTDIKINQPMTVTAKTTSKKPAVVKFVNLRNKNQVVAAKNAYTVSKSQGKVTYKKLSGNGNITVASNGNITVKKGLKKGIYAIKVRVTATGGAKYKSGYKDVTVYVKVQ